MPGRPSRPAGRSRHAATKTATATAITTNVSSLLPNSIQVLTIVWPGVRAATMLLVVHSGQSGQPSPDWLSLTAAPVTMIPEFATTLASARPRMDCGLGRQTRAISRAAALVRAGPAEPSAAAVRLGDAPDVRAVDPPESPEALAPDGAPTLVATCSS